MVLNTKHFKSICKPLYDWDTEMKEVLANGRISLPDIQVDQLERGKFVVEIIENNKNWFIVDIHRNARLSTRELKNITEAIEASKEWYNINKTNHEVIIKKVLLKKYHILEI